jgi:hypothetical protein
VEKTSPPYCCLLLSMTVGIRGLNPPPAVRFDLISSCPSPKLMGGDVDLVAMDCSVTRNTKDKPGPVFQTASLLLSASRFIILFPRVKACPDAVSNSSRDERPIWLLFVKTVVRAATRVPITWYQCLCLSISTRTSQPSRNVRRLCTRTVPF